MTPAPQTLDLRQYATEAEWLAARLSFLTATEGAAVLCDMIGEPWFSDGYSVWLSHAHPEHEQYPSRAHLEMGHDLEPVALAAYERETGMDVTPYSNALIVHPDGWMSASPDGLCGQTFGDTDVWHGVEAKSSRDMDAWSRAPGEPIPARMVQAYLPIGYGFQVILSMACADWDRWDIVVFLPFFQTRIYQIERDQALEERLLEILHPWWERHIQDGEEPPVTGSDVVRAWQAQRYRHKTDTIRTATEAEVRLLEQYRATDEAYKEADRERKRLQAELREAIGEDEGITGPAGTVTWRADVNGRRRLMPRWK